MGSHKILTCVFATLIVYLTLIEHSWQVSATPRATSNPDANHRSKTRPYLRFAPRPLNQFVRIKPDLGDFIVDDDDFFELNKRQTSDDYGHLRFGKRDEFDDYGHMRFGRSGTESRK